jgi:hypothetical protein
VPCVNKSVEIFDIVTVLSLTSSCSVPTTTFVIADCSTFETRPLKVFISVSAEVILLP